MGDMTNSTNIESGLSAHNLGGIRGQTGDVFIELRPKLLVAIDLLLDFLFRETLDIFHKLL